MKKQFLILATLTTIAFISCSKQKIEEPPANQPEETAGAMNNEAKGKGGNPLDNGLVGRFEFDGNLNDKTAQLAPGFQPSAGYHIQLIEKVISTRLSDSMGLTVSICTMCPWIRICQFLFG